MDSVIRGRGAPERAVGHFAWSGQTISGIGGGPGGIDQPGARA